MKTEMKMKINVYKIDNIFCKICLQIEFCFPSKFISFFYYFDINIHTKNLKTHETFVINNVFFNVLCNFGWFSSNLQLQELLARVLPFQVLF